MSSKFKMNRITSFVSFLTGAISTLHRNFIPKDKKTQNGVQRKVQLSIQLLRSF